MLHGSLFSGIGGFDLASSIMGWDNAFHCEWDTFCQKILKYYWPHAKSYTDIRNTDFSVWRGKIDILTGGFPCQPLSVAGKRRGDSDDRFLWPEMLRAIREIKPTWIVGENVAGITSMAYTSPFWEKIHTFLESSTHLAGAYRTFFGRKREFGILAQIIEDIEKEGYETQVFLIPAGAISAPHSRDRAWIVAHSNCGGNDQAISSERDILQGDVSKNQEQEGGGYRGKTSGFGDEQSASNASKKWITEETNQRGQKYRKGWEKVRKESGTTDGCETPPDSESEGGTRFPIREKTKHSINGVIGSNETPPNTNQIGLEGGIVQSKEDRRIKRLRTQASRFTNFWEEFPTQSPVCGRDDGIPSVLDSITIPKWREESIKAYGNAIVPQVVLQIFQAIEVYEQNQKEMGK